MTTEEQSFDDVLNKFYRTLIAFQATALDFVTAGNGNEDKSARAVAVTGWIAATKQTIASEMGCSGCSDEEVCCPGGGCALPGCCNIPMAALAEQKS